MLAEQAGRARGLGSEIELVRLYVQRSTHLDDNLHRLAHILDNGLFVGGDTCDSLDALNGALHCSNV